MNKKRIILVLIIVVAVFSSAANAALFFSQDRNNTGLYEVDVTTGAATLVGISGVSGANNGLAPSGDPAVLFGSEPFGLLHIQADGSGSVDVGGDTHEGLAYCTGNSTLYGAINGSFYSIDTTTGVRIATLTAPGFDMEGLACDSATGTVYGVGNSNNLLSYNTVANSWSAIGDTGINWDQGGLAWDPAGILYAVGQGAGNNLYSINPATAASTLIGDLGITAEGGLAFAGPASPAFGSPQAIPSLSTWGLLMLMLGLGFVARRRLMS